MGPQNRTDLGLGAKSLSLQGLAQRLEALCCGAGRREGVVSTGVREIDGVLPGGGLGLGRVHEWLGTAGLDRETGRPSLGIVSELAGRAAGRAAGSGRAVWVGGAVWPYPASLAQASRRLRLDLFVRAERAGDRLWAADVALRSRACAAVVADGSGFDLAATRRLQLAAECGGGLCLLARPPREACELSAAATRWLVSVAASPAAHSMNRRWTVELLRCKGMRPTHASCVWTLERDHATRALRVAADVLDRSGQAAADAAGIRRTG